MGRYGNGSELSALPIIFGVLLVLAAAPAHAVLQGVAIEDRLDASSVRETLTIDLTGNKAASFVFALPPGAKDATVNGNAAAIVNGSLDITLACQTCRLQVTYTIPDAVNSEGIDVLAYSRTLNLPQTPERLSYRVILPRGSFIDGEPGSADPPVVPQASAIRTDGTSIIIEWTEERPILPKRYFVRFSDHESGEDLQSEFLTELTEWPVWTLALLALLIGLGLGMTLQRFKKRSVSATLPYVPASLLSPDERKVLVILEKHKPVWQKEIIQRTGWSKSKVSAIVTNLDHKGIVERERVGRSFKVTLVKEIGE